MKDGYKSTKKADLSKSMKKNILSKQVKRPAMTSSGVESTAAGNNQTSPMESQGGATLPPVSIRSLQTFI